MNYYLVINDEIKFDGKFTYTTPINGSYHLTFSMISFEDQKREFSIENNNLTVKF